MLQNDKERAGIASLLQRIPANELRSLAETIAGRLIRVETREEASSAVLTYATSALDVLRRKKMKKEYMYHYLHEQRCLNITPAMDKIEVVRATLQFWESADAQIEMLMEEMDVCVETPSEAFATIDSNSSGNSSSIQGELEFGQQFVGWFYPLMNNGHVANPNAADNFGPQLFWPDCRMKIVSPQYEQLVEGDEMVARSLLTLIGENMLFFNPFDAQQGIRCHCDPHGLVVVLVGGSVHRGDDSVGIFEQKFGLVRDPTAHNKWKIKLLDLKLNGKDLNMATDYQLSLA